MFWLVYCVACSGFTDVIAAAGLDEGAIFFGENGFMASCPYLASSTAATFTDERSIQFVMLALDICHDPKGLSRLELAGLWQLVFIFLTQRPAVCAAAVTAGVYEVAMVALGKIPLSERVSWRTPAGVQAFGIFHTLTQPCLTVSNGIPGVDMLQLVADSGYADAIASALKVRQSEPVTQCGLRFCVFGCRSIWCMNI
jgi:hypothetical protein